MSRLARKPFKLPEGVTMSEDSGRITAKGPKGTLVIPMLQQVSIKIENGEVKVSNTGNSKQSSANTGTMFSLLKNASEGVSAGFIKQLEIEGVGFKAAMEGNTIVLSLGFVNPIKLPAPEGITISVEKSVIKVSGMDKGLVGQVAAEIRSYKKPEPYKGKGIHYVGEVIQRKVGKKAGAAAA